MKKILALLLAISMLICFNACGKKEDSKSDETTKIADTEDAPATEPVEGDPAEYGREFWEAKYPGENVCPFIIDEGGVERNYYWVSGVDGWDGTMESWIKQPFNWNGWHKTDDGAIVNKDETLKITDDWANGDESMSSYCTVTTEPYDKDNTSSSGTDANVPELAIKTPDELVCVENERFVAKFSGEHSEDNDVFFADLGEDSLYYVWDGFNEDGSIDQISGHTCLYYFFADEESYNNALDTVASYDLRHENKDCLYITVNTPEPDDYDYEDMMNTFGEGADYRHPDFLPVN